MVENGYTKEIDRSSDGRAGLLTLADITSVADMRNLRITREAGRSSDLSGLLDFSHLSDLSHLSYFSHKSPTTGDKTGSPLLSSKVEKYGLVAVGLLALYAGRELLPSRELLPESKLLLRDAGEAERELAGKQTTSFVFSAPGATHDGIAPTVGAAPRIEQAAVPVRPATAEEKQGVDALMQPDRLLEPVKAREPGEMPSAGYNPARLPEKIVPIWPGHRDRLLDTLVEADSPLIKLSGVTRVAFPDPTEIGVPTEIHFRGHSGPLELDAAAVTYRDPQHIPFCGGFESDLVISAGTVRRSDAIPEKMIFHIPEGENGNGRLRTIYRHGGMVTKDKKAILEGAVNFPDGGISPVNVQDLSLDKNGNLVVETALHSVPDTNYIQFANQQQFEHPLLVGGGRTYHSALFHGGNMGQTIWTDDGGMIDYFDKAPAKVTFIYANGQERMKEFALIERTPTHVDYYEGGENRTRIRLSLSEPLPAAVRQPQEPLNLTLLDEDGDAWGRFGVAQVKESYSPEGHAGDWP